jgi:hypothetical protein
MPSDGSGKDSRRSMTDEEFALHLQLEEYERTAKSDNSPTTSTAIHSYQKKGYLNPFHLPSFQT